MLWRLEIYIADAQIKKWGAYLNMYNDVHINCMNVNG